MKIRFLLLPIAMGMTSLGSCQPTPRSISQEISFCHQPTELDRVIGKITRAEIGDGAKIALFQHVLFKLENVTFVSPSPIYPYDKNLEIRTAFWELKEVLSELAKMPDEKHSRELETDIIRAIGNSLKVVAHLVEEDPNLYLGEGVRLCFSMLKTAEKLSPANQADCINKIQEGTMRMITVHKRVRGAPELKKEAERAFGIEPKDTPIAEGQAETASPSL